MTWTHPHATSCCYRYSPVKHHYDPELIWQLIQRHQGHISIAGDCIDFYIPRQYQMFIQLAFPELQRRPKDDWL